MTRMSTRPSRTRAVTSIIAATTLVLSACTTSPPDDPAGDDPIRVGAVYPLSGSQGQGGIDEHRGALLAAELVNAGGGVGGRPIELVSTDVAAAEAARGAVERFSADGIDLV